MESEDRVYRDLQIHLDKQTIGFPETQSGSDIVLLKQLFSPAQAEIVRLLTYRYQSLEEIQVRARKIGRADEETERLLDETAAKGIIGHRRKDGTKQYKTIPYVIGMLEAAALNPTRELLSAIARYNEDGLFWRDFINTKVPQMRTIPIQKSITAKHHIGNYDEIRNIIGANTGPIVILECVCRKGAEKAGTPCKQT